MTSGDIDKPAQNTGRLKLAVLQRVCTAYRAHLFRALAADPRVELRLFIGDDVPNSKVRSGGDLSGIDIAHLPTRFVRVGHRSLAHHKGLLRQLKEFRPDVILAEGESNLLSYLKALAYRSHRPHVGLVHWSLGGLPGEPMVRGGLRGWAVNFLRRRFDAFVVYSSYGKQVLVANGFDEDRIFVAVNVSDLSRHLALAEDVSHDEAKRNLGNDGRFMVLFVGAMTREKRLEVLLDAASELAPDRYRVVLIGDGDVYGWLAEQIAARRLDHVELAGRVTEGLENYYHSADVVALPGRGGMVISEAMAYGCPVIAYQADGTEYDLVVDGATGVRLRKGTAVELRGAIQQLGAAGGGARRMGREAKRRVTEQFNTDTMVSSILAAVFRARQLRNKGGLAGPRAL